MSMITFEKELDQVLIEGINSKVRKMILNRPTKRNSINYVMALQLLKNLKEYEQNPNVNLVMIKGNGKAFSAGADLVSLLGLATAGHWSFAAKYYIKLLTLLHLNATYKKPLVTIVNGLTMGAGAALSTFASFRIVTENTRFSMPEIIMGLFPNVGAGYFLSRLPGYFGEYLGFTGARIDGADMVACGLATHLVPFKDLDRMECELEEVAVSSTTMDNLKIKEIIDKYALKPSLKQDSPLKKLEIINECFSKATVETILLSLVDLSLKNEDKFILHAISSMKYGSPTTLKIFHKLIREGRMKSLEKCFVDDYNVNISLKKFNDPIEGVRAMLMEKDKKPQWNPSTLEEVKEETVNKYFEKADDDEYEPLVLDASRTLNDSLMISVMRPKL